MAEALDSLRLDKWLWAARFYKTRSLATAAISAGHVHLNAERVKPAKTVKLGDIVRIRKGSVEMTVSVDGISGKRGSATLAQALYTESEQSIASREQSRARIRAESAGAVMDHKPNKQERRALVRIKHSQQ